MSNITVSRERKRARVRARISGTSQRPRLSVCRTISGMYAQLIDDENSKTLVWADWREVDVKKFSKNNVTRSNAVGKLLAEKAKKAKIASVVFDRGGFAYHGKVKALAEGAREGGLQF